MPPVLKSGAPPKAELWSEPAEPLKSLPVEGPWLPIPDPEPPPYAEPPSLEPDCA